MLKPVALALLLAWQLEPFYMIEHYRGPGKVSCQTEPVRPGFTCATVFNLDPPLPDGISSIRGGDYAVIRGVALILNGTLYTCLFDPPLKQNDRFPGLSRDQRIPARVEGNDLFVKLPDGKEAKAKIIRRESLHPNQPQPA
jgi:hypothetical protein